MDNIYLSQQLKNYIGYAHAKFTQPSTDPNNKALSNYKYDNEYLSTKEQDNIYGLYLFMKCNPQVSNEQLKDVIYEEANQFRVLRALCREYHGIIGDIRSFGFNKICYSIVQTRKLSTSPHNI